MISESFLDRSTETTKKSVAESLQNSFDFRGIYNNKGEIVPSYIENFLNNGLDVNSIDASTDETLLILASRLGNLRLVKFLISKNASLHVKNVRVM